jgi:hypothetical protein
VRSLSHIILSRKAIAEAVTVLLSTRAAITASMRLWTPALSSITLASFRHSMPSVTAICSARVIRFFASFQFVSTYRNYRFPIVLRFQGRRDNG